MNCFKYISSFTIKEIDGGVCGGGVTGLGWWRCCGGGEVGWCGGGGGVVVVRWCGEVVVGMWWRVWWRVN